MMGNGSVGFCICAVSCQVIVETVMRRVRGWCQEGGERGIKVNDRAYVMWYFDSERQLFANHLFDGVGWKR